MNLDLNKQLIKRQSFVAESARVSLLPNDPNARQPKYIWKQCLTSFLNKIELYAYQYQKE